MRLEDQIKRNQSWPSAKQATYDVTRTPWGNSEVISLTPRSAAAPDESNGPAEEIDEFTGVVKCAGDTCTRELCSKGIRAHYSGGWTESDIATAKLAEAREALEIQRMAQALYPDRQFSDIKPVQPSNQDAWAALAKAVERSVRADERIANLETAVAGGE